ncbi:MAG: outer membrane beta-barrel protein, partial [Candidatus Kapabacteria bacterium]|nr:outer membrane beta-barrel protein [Candidatus Kapabacteria bacterium]
LSNGIESSDNFGWQAGAFTQFGLFDLLALGLELTVDQRSFTLTQGTTSVDVKTTSLSLPVLLRIGLPLKLMLELGPQYTHFLSTNNATTTDGQGFAVIGMIWKPALGLQFDLRYLRGLSTISTSLDGDVNVNVTQFSVGYAF